MGLPCRVMYHAFLEDMGPWHVMPGPALLADTQLKMVLPPYPTPTQGLIKY